MKEGEHRSNGTSSEASLNDQESLSVKFGGGKNRFIRFLHLVRSRASVLPKQLQHFKTVKHVKYKCFVVVITCLVLIFYGIFLTFERGTFSVVYGYRSVLHRNSTAESHKDKIRPYDDNGNLRPEAIRNWTDTQKEIAASRPIALGRSQLGSYDTSNLISMQNFDLMATSEYLTDRTYLPFKVRSYQGNANIDRNVDKDKQCSAISFEDEIYYSNEVKYIDEDRYELMKRLMKQDPRLKEVFEKIASDKKASLKEVAEKYLFRFGSSAQWIEDYQCYLVYSRLVVSPSKYRNLGYFSLITSQAYDKKWNEIKGKKIPYLDVSIPDDIDEQIDAIEAKYPESNCSSISDEFLSEKCVKEQEINKELMEDEKFELLSRYYRIYPSLIKVPFKIYEKWSLSGPEDPKISLRKNRDGRTEPIIFFNRGHEFLGRIMHAVLPHRVIVNSFPLYIPGEKMKGSQKNWSPFYYDEDGASEPSRGTVNLVTTVSPLTVVKCSLDSGVCEKTFNMEQESGNSGDYHSSLRGGTSYVKLPPVVPELRGRNIWVGFVKPHIDNCGASMRFYRPSLVILEESEGKFYYSLITDQFDFDRPVRSWKLKDDYGAGGYNVRSPNSIISWDILSQNNDTREYEDYMQISYSEADFDSYIFVVKGVVNYIINAFRTPDLYEFMVWKKPETGSRNTLQNFCFLKNFVKYCDAYGAEHPET